METKFKAGDVIRLADSTTIAWERTYYFVKKVDSTGIDKLYNLYHIYSGSSHVRSVYYTDRAYEKVV